LAKVYLKRRGASGTDSNEIEESAAVNIAKMIRLLRRSVSPLRQPHLLPYARIENCGNPNAVYVTR